MLAVPAERPLSTILSARSMVNGSRSLVRKVRAVRFVAAIPGLVVPVGTKLVHRPRPLLSVARCLLRAGHGGCFGVESVGKGMCLVCFEVAVTTQWGSDVLGDHWVGPCAGAYA